MAVGWQRSTHGRQTASGSLSLAFPQPARRRSALPCACCACLGGCRSGRSRTAQETGICARLGEDVHVDRKHVASKTRNGRRPARDASVCEQHGRAHDRSPGMSHPLPDSAALIALAQRLETSGYRFVTPTPLTHQHVNQRPENRTAASLRDVFGWSRLIPESMLPVEEAQGLLAAGILERKEDGLKSRVRFSSLDDLLLVHSAFPTADEDSVFFGPDTYRFAQSINRHLQGTSHPINRAVDIGCGTGAGAMLIAVARPQAQVHAVDINPKALHFAQTNATVAGLKNMECCHSDILSGLSGNFDLIVANPPYMKDTQRRAYRHGGDALGADLSVRILRESLDRLTPGGSL
ncbi:Uncharacterized protein ALO42_04287, partial [Pseudomonas syringae pv. atrofaciens]